VSQRAVGLPACRACGCCCAGPGERISKSLGVSWLETVPAGDQPLGGVTSARVATGVNHGAQQRDSNLTLAAGVLFGLGGGALIAAVQGSAPRLTRRRLAASR